MTAKGERRHSALRCIRTSFVIPLICIFLLPEAAAASQCEWVPVCGRSLQWLNSNRYIYGVFTEECNWHGPWDQLGVDTPYHTRFTYSDEFYGHGGSGGDEWVGCTDPNHVWGPPRCDYYNSDNCTTQRVDSERVIHNQYLGTTAMECQAIYGGGFDIYNFWMAVWGNDVGNPDDHYSTLYYPTLYIPITCTDEWNCSGTTDTVFPSSADPSGLTAGVRVSFQSWVDYECL